MQNPSPVFFTGSYQLALRSADRATRSGRRIDTSSSSSSAAPQPRRPLAVRGKRNKISASIAVEEEEEANPAEADDPFSICSSVVETSNPSMVVVNEDDAQQYEQPTSPVCFISEIGSPDTQVRHESEDEDHQASPTYTPSSTPQHSEDEEEEEEDHALCTHIQQVRREHALCFAATRPVPPWQIRPGYVTPPATGSPTSPPPVVRRGPHKKRMRRTAQQDGGGGNNDDGAMRNVFAASTALMAMRAQE